MKILFATAECVPFIKTGGLADVAGALPKEIIKSGADVRVILPLYKQVPQKWREQMEDVMYTYIDIGVRHEYAGIKTLTFNDVTYYFVDSEYYFGRDYIYGSNGNDEAERFAFFCRVVLNVMPMIDFVPDVLHCHDWQTGLIPVMLEVQYRHLPVYSQIRTVYTIHNLQYQGVCGLDHMEYLVHLGRERYTSDKLEFYGAASCMKAGLVYANKITTVSPTYAQEIQSPYYGEKLDGLLRARSGDLVGILNGIDNADYAPASDEHIWVNYWSTNIEDKAENKIMLQRELGLEQNRDIPMIGMIGRLASQKGLDLVARVLPEIMETGAQMVMLGTGDPELMRIFGEATQRYPHQFATCFRMNNELAHQIYAGADLFLMPSAFEPCGLSQLISLRYGTLPIVRETGGLKDTVTPYNRYTGEGNGFSFTNYNAHDMLHVVREAIDMYRNDRATFNEIARRNMCGSYGWDESARKYVDLYCDLTGKSPEEPVAVPAEEVAPEVTPEAPVEVTPIEDAPVAPAEEAAVETVAEPAPVEEATVETAAEPAPVEEAPVAEVKPAPKKRTVRKKAEPAEGETGEAPVKKTRTRKAKAETAEAAEATEAPVKKTRTRKAKAETAEAGEIVEAPVKKTRTRKPKAETAEGEAPVKKPRATRKKATPAVEAEAAPVPETVESTATPETQE